MLTPLLNYTFNPEVGIWLKILNVIRNVKFWAPTLVAIWLQHKEYSALGFVILQVPE